LEQIAREYTGKIIVYKVNTDNEQVLSGSLGITSLPTILFVPASGKPQVLYGAYPKETIIKVVNEFLLVKK
jgi:thioredoxin-like negative regulator of GroEL